MLKLTSFKIGTRLASGFGAICVLLLIIAAIAISQISKIQTEINTEMTEARKMIEINEVRISIDEIYFNIYGLVAANNKTTKDSFNAAIAKSRAEYKERLEDLQSKAKTQVGKELLNKLNEEVTNARSINQQIITMALKTEGIDTNALDLFNTKAVKYNTERIHPAIDEIVAWREKRIKLAEDSLTSAILKAKLVLETGSIAALLLGLVFSLFIARSIVAPIRQFVSFTRLLAQGDFSKTIPEKYLGLKDELGDLAQAYNTMVKNVHDLLKVIITNVETTTSSALDLLTFSTQTSQSVQNMSKSSSTVAIAAERANADTASAASSILQTTANLSSVASATENISNMIGEIASQSEKARTISSNASNQANSVSSLMQQLDTAAREIGSVTEIITNISSQTNLLALNATIESARAGEAGKGFGVVANEIKELANQTKDATGEIKVRTEGIQSLVENSINDINKITYVISDMENIVSSIAAAIDEQVVMTRDVAVNTADASTGLNESNELITQIAAVSNSIALEIAEVSSASNEVREISVKVQSNISELSDLAGQLKGFVNNFKV